MISLIVLCLGTTPIALDEVRALAQQNTDALKAELEARRVREQVGVSQSAILPQIGLEAGASQSVSGPQRVFATVPDPSAATGFRQQPIDVPGFSRAHYSLGVTVSQLLYDGGRWWNQIAQTQSLAEAQKGQAEEQKLASEVEAVRRFFELLRAQRTLILLDELVERSGLQVERAKALYEAGKGAMRDWLDAEVNLGNDRISVLRQGRMVSDAEAALAVWLGRTGTEELAALAPDELQQAPTSLQAMTEYLEAARRNRPMLKALRAQLEAAKKNVSMAQSGYWPRLSVQGSYLRQSPTADPFFNNLNLQNNFTGGASLTWQLFDGGNVRSQVEQASVNRNAAILTLEQTERELEAEIKRAHKGLEAAVKVHEVSRANLQVAQRAMTLAEERFAAGAGSTMDVRDAQLKLAQAEVSTLESRIDVEISRAALERAMGVRMEAMKK